MEQFDEPQDVCDWAENNPTIFGKVFSALTRKGYVTIYRRPDAPRPIFEWSYGYDGAFVDTILNLF